MIILVVRDSDASQHVNESTLTRAACDMEVAAQSAAWSVLAMEVAVRSAAWRVNWL